MAQTIKDVVTWLKQWYYTEDEVDDLLDEKQDSLVSGTNIKTINNNSLLGSGNITIQGGSGGDGSLTKITLAEGYDLYVNDNNHLAMLHIHKSVSLSGQWNTLLASAIPLDYRPLGWLGIPNNDDTIIVGDDGGIYYNNFSGSSSKTLDNQVNWFFVGGTSSYNVALTSNKSILSYYDSESAILTATVTDGSDNPVADVTVEFFNGSTSMGTATTNSNGIATKTYNSQGSGDVSITATANNENAEITISDRLYYWNGLIDRTSDFTTGLCEGGTAGRVTFDSTKGIQFYHGSKATLDRIGGVALPTNCEIEVTFASRRAGVMGVGLTSGNGNADICTIDGSNMGGGYRYTNSSWKGSIYSSKSYGSETYPLSAKLVKNDRTCYFEVNGVQANTFTMQFASTDTVYTGVGGNSSMNCYISGFSIKQL